MMTDDTDEVVLAGGNVNRVVKVGNTVRRQMVPQSDTVHAFLLHLEAKNVATPRFLGIDEHGREILSFIDGSTDFPKTLWQEDCWLNSSASLLRAFHDASLGFCTDENARWAFEYPDPKRHEVINHNDFAPYNMVFGSDGSISVIDCDLCGPGPRARDLAYLAYWLAPLSFGPNAIVQNAILNLEFICARIRTLCLVYGFEQPLELLPMVSEVLHHMSNEDAVAKMVGVDVTARLKAEGHLEHWAAEALAFDEKQDELSILLSPSIR